MKILKGQIVSLKMQKTASVLVVSKKPHPLYKKVLKRSKKYFADTGDFVLSEGDWVIIAEIKPISKRKHFKIIEVIRPKDQEKRKGGSKK